VINCSLLRSAILREFGLPLEKVYRSTDHVTRAVHSTCRHWECSPQFKYNSGVERTRAISV